MFRPGGYVRIGWQLVGGVWHQVVRRRLYNEYGCGSYYTEELLPEPHVTLESAGRLMRESYGIFGYMRYW